MRHKPPLILVKRDQMPGKSGAGSANDDGWLTAQGAANPFGDTIGICSAGVRTELQPVQAAAAAWGYYFFPLVTRYTRTFGLTNYGITGRFKASWADFGGLKLPAQLDVECASIVANAARCDIGDQMPPGERKSGMPLSVLMPAPVNATPRCAAASWWPVPR